MACSRPWLLIGKDAVMKKGKKIRMLDRAAVPGPRGAQDPLQATGVTADGVGNQHRMTVTVARTHRRNAKMLLIEVPIALHEARYEL